MRFLPRVVVLSAVLLVILFASSPTHAECERLYPDGLNQTCRAAQSPTIEQVNLEAVSFYFPDAPFHDYCRLDILFTGDFSSLSAALDGGRVRHGEYNQLRPAVVLAPIEVTPTSLRASIVTSL